ncbi:MAG TPA: hypothetical protein VF702_09915 [Allosphingosinicella sp.]
MTGQAGTIEGGEPAAAPVLFREAPVFGAARFALSYAFELDSAVSGERRCAAFRLATLDRDLEPGIHESLIGPVRSFHDDVTVGRPGRGGRPLIFAAAPPEEDPALRRVDFVRPRRWSYAAENRCVEIEAGKAACRLALEYRDYFCAFGSGRLFYVITFFAEEGQEAALDEYSLIWFEKLSLAAPERDYYGSRVRFEQGGLSDTLVELVGKRLEHLASSGGPAPNGVRDIVLSHLFKDGIGPVGWESVRSLAIGLDDDWLFETACFVEELEIGKFEVEPDPAGGTVPHNPLALAPEVRRSLALAGILQAIPDFPKQDRSEIWDSTRCLYKGPDFRIFGHPRFTVEIAINWRTLAEAQDCLGHCPYFSLMWLVAVHDEIIVTEIEERIDELIYGAEAEGAHCVEPLADLRKLLDAVANPMKRGATRILRQNIVGRFELFRELSINQSSRMLRYDKEALALEAMKDGMGTSGRYQRAHELLDRLEAIVEDAHELNRTYSARLMSSLLAAIALTSIVSVMADLTEAKHLALVIGLAAAVLVALAAIAVILSKLRD